MPFVLTAETVPDVLRRAELLGPDEPCDVQPLAGGVSSTAFRARTADRGFFLKQALPVLRVKEEWRADPGRIRAESLFARLIRERWGPSVAPEPLHLDDENHVLVTAAAPEGFVPWRERLLAGQMEPAIAEAAGRWLADLHNLGLKEPGLAKEFERPQAFDELRIDPYLRACVRKHPERAFVLSTLAEHLGKTHLTLVHGDYSPKNMLTDGKGFLVVDHETANWGEPWFDVAFLTTHLLLKAVKRPPDTEALLGLAGAFWGAYNKRAEARLRSRDQKLLVRLVGALLLARVDGKSPVDYLDFPQRDLVRQRAKALVREPPSTLDALWAWWSASR